MGHSLLVLCLLLLDHTYIHALQYGQNSTARLTVVDSGIQYDGESWTAYEDLTRIDGSLYFLSQSGKSRNFTRYLEPSFDPAPGSGSVEFFLGLNQSEVNLALPDLLADALLSNGEPVEIHVRDAVPQIIFSWQSFVGNVQANDTMFISQRGSTNNIAPLRAITTVNVTEYFPNSYDGLVGGFMPTIRKLWRSKPESDNWLEVIVFGDADSVEPFITKTWFRTTLVVDGKIIEQHFSREYPASPPARLDPAPEEFYGALLRSGDYWDANLDETSVLTLPDQSWADFMKHTFAVELLVRYGGKHKPAPFLLYYLIPNRYLS